MKVSIEKYDSSAKWPPNWSEISRHLINYVDKLARTNRNFVTDDDIENLEVEVCDQMPLDGTWSKSDSLYEIGILTGNGQFVFQGGAVLLLQKSQLQ